MRPNATTGDFCECPLEFGSEDLGYICVPFPWRRGEIRERLDRAVCMWGGHINFLGWQFAMWGGHINFLQR